MTAWNRLFDAVAGEGRKFFDSLDDPQRIQQAVLTQIIANNAATEFGRLYQFSNIRSIEQYQHRVPVQRYEDLADQITRVSEGAQNVLTAGPAIAFEQTGGSSRGQKLIPYTAAAMRSFQQALYPWLYKLLSDRPSIMQGSSYWSISPALRKIMYTPGGTRIGIANDAEYFGDSLATDIGQLLAAPPTLGEIREHSDWQYLTLRYLLAANDLTLISVWSPTFLLDLMSALQTHYELLAEDIHNGEINIDLTAFALQDHPLLLQPDPDRAEELIDACHTGTLNTRRLWPRLDTLSCWLDASAARYRSNLKTQFPDINLQGKGLLATEGVISLPVCHEDASVLAVNSGFYEFIDAQDRVHLAHEVCEGEVYRVIMSNHAGFYRYDLGDLVQVTGWLDATPLLRFVGRGGIVSDLCGEKLTESFVQTQLRDTTGFALLMPDIVAHKGYRLIVDAAQYNASAAERFAGQLDRRLSHNPQYAYAREIGQLSDILPVRVEAAWDNYLHYERKQQRRLGDIKPLALSTDEKLYAHLIERRQRNAGEVVSLC